MPYIFTNYSVVAFYDIKGEYPWMANTYLESGENKVFKGVKIDGTHWPTTEHYFQAMKFPDHKDYQKAILAYGKNGESMGGLPNYAKQLMAQFKLTLDPTWHTLSSGNIPLSAKKHEVMRKALRAKIEQYPVYAKALNRIHPQTLIIQASPNQDWGYGDDGQGANELGILWKEILLERRTGADSTQLRLQAYNEYKEFREVTPLTRDQLCQAPIFFNTISLSEGILQQGLYKLYDEEAKVYIAQDTDKQFYFYNEANQNIGGILPPLYREAAIYSYDNIINLHEQKFQTAIESLKKKTDELIAKGNQNSPDFDKYKTVGGTAQTLIQSLTDARSDFFTQRNISAQQFVQRCSDAIQTAMPEFKKSRTIWAQLHPIIKGILGVIAVLFLGIPAIVTEFTTKHGFKGTFFDSKTDSEKQLHTFDQDYWPAVAPYGYSS